MEEEQTTIGLPRDLLRRAKRKAAAEGRSLSSLIADGLRMMLADDRRSAGTKRVLPPVSKARGGLLSGADVADSSPLSDDIEYMRRLTRSV